MFMPNSEEVYEARWFASGLDISEQTDTVNVNDLHAANVAACMGAMAQHFNEDKEHWEAIGYLHDYDYKK